MTDEGIAARVIASTFKTVLECLEEMKEKGVQFSDEQTIEKTAEDAISAALSKISLQLIFENIVRVDEHGQEIPEVPPEDN